MLMRITKIMLNKENKQLNINDLLPDTFLSCQ